MLQWLSEEEWQKYLDTYCGASVNDMWKAVETMCRLFYEVSRWVAEHNGFSFDQQEADHSFGYFTAVRKTDQNATSSLITLKEDAGLTATINDITGNPKNLKLQELEAAQVARVRSEVAYIVLNGNYALEAGLSVGKDSIAYESSSSTAAKTYVNIIAVKEGHENDEAIQALVKVLKSDEIKKFINEKYDGAVVPFE